MTTTPPDAPDAPVGPPPDGPRTSREEVRDLGRLRRSTGDRKVAGVAGGLARHLDVDPLVLRVLLVVLAFFGGAGLLVYGACWLFVPQDDGREAVVQLDERTRSIVLAIAGAFAAVALVGDSWGLIGVPWPLVLLAGLVLYLMTRGPRKPASSGPAPGAPPASQQPPWQQPAWQQPAWQQPTWQQPAWQQPTHQSAAAPPGPWQPAWQPPPPVARPGNPRRRGPLLFPFAAALAALGLGVLGILDTAGVAVPPSAYPALVLGVCGVVLLVGAVYGRAGGVVAVGLLAAVATCVVTVGERVDGDSVTVRPATAAEVATSYENGIGELVVDLTQVSDLEALDGRRLSLDVEVGRIELVVPPGLDVAGSAAVNGPGHLDLFGAESGGIEIDGSVATGRGGDQPRITVDAEIEVGEIEMRTR